MYKRLELDSNNNGLAKDKNKLKMDEGWENYRIFCSLNNKGIKERNKEMIIEKDDEYISEPSQRD